MVGRWYRIPDSRHAAGLDALRRLARQFRAVRRRAGRTTRGHLRVRRVRTNLSRQALRTCEGGSTRKTRVKQESALEPAHAKRGRRDQTAAPGARTCPIREWIGLKVGGTSYRMPSETSHAFSTAFTERLQGTYETHESGPIRAPIRAPRQATCPGSPKNFPAKPEAAADVRRIRPEKSAKRRMSAIQAGSDSAATRCPRRT